jgi:uncharacterized coiled-coil DUF342 family protein
MSAITKKDLSNLETRLVTKIDENSTQLRQEFKESTNSVLEVIAQMAETTHKQLSGIRDELDEIRIDLGMMKRELNNLNSDIDKAFKNKSITEEETVALIAGQKRLERWIEQIAQETGVKLAV